MTPTEYVQSWAQTCRIRVTGLPATVDELHRLAFAGARYRTEERIVAWVRHNRTNYENLCRYLSDRPSVDGPNCARDVLRGRVNSRIRVVLERQYGPGWSDYGRKRTK